MRVKEIFDEVIFNGDLYHSNDVVEVVTGCNEKAGIFFYNYLLKEEEENIILDIPLIKNKEDNVEIIPMGKKKGRKSKVVEDKMEGDEIKKDIGRESDREDNTGNKDNKDEDDMNDIKRLAKLLGKRKKSVY